MADAVSYLEEEGHTEVDLEEEEGPHALAELKQEELPKAVPDLEEREPSAPRHLLECQALADAVSVAFER